MDSGNKKPEPQTQSISKKAEALRIQTDQDTRQDRRTIGKLNARYGQIFGKLMSTRGAVSVGKKKTGRTRQIINVAAGTNDTDAVNVYQLKAVESKITQTGAEAQKHTSVASGTNISVTEDGTNNEGGKNYKVSLAENIDLGQNGSIKAGNTTINKDGLTVQGGPSVTTDGIDAGKNVITNVAAGTKDTDAVNVSQLKEVREIAAAKTTIEAGDNIKVEKGSANGSYKLNVKTDGKIDAVNTGIVTGSTVYNETRVANNGNYIKKDYTAGQNLTALDKGISNLVNGMGKLGTDSAVAENGKYVKKNKTAGENLTALDNQVKANAEKIGSVEGRMDTLAGRMGKLGTDSAVAEDGAYVKKDKTVGENLTAMDKQVQANAGEIGALVNGMGALDSRVNKVGAGSAALAALHPLDFDPEDKWNFAAGYGHYKGANALAIGAFYRPDENKMISIGGSFGSGENMINAGVSFKVGEGTSPYAGVSKAQLAQRISRQDEIIRRQDEELAAQKEQIREILAQLEAMKKA